MATKSDRFPSEHLRADDFLDGTGKPRAGNFTITGISEVEFEKDDGVVERKTTIHFKETPKKWIVSPTKWESVAEILNELDDDNWIGRRIQLFRGTATYMGKKVGSIQARPCPEPTTKGKSAPPPVVEDEDVPGDDVDDLPF